MTASTSSAVSPDSGLPWMDEGAWPVAEGVFRIPLPLPNDGLRAVNVYVLESDAGLTLVDGGWALAPAREMLERSLASIDHTLGDITQFLVTHIHRDHFTMATVLGKELGADVFLGEDERPALDFIRAEEDLTVAHFAQQLTGSGAGHLAGRWPPGTGEPRDLDIWHPPTRWLRDDVTLAAGERVLDAVHTPGHTPGHYVYVDQKAALLFAGDHVLPTITPSIGFTAPMVEDSLGMFMASLAKVRALPDLRLLPAHGPVTDSSHTRAEELLAFHEQRLDDTLAGVNGDGSTALDVAGTLGWTRHGRSHRELAVFEQGLAVLETRAHLDVLVARGQLSVRDDGGVSVFSSAPPTAVPSQ